MNRTHRSRRRGHPHPGRRRTAPRHAAPRRRRLRRLTACCLVLAPLGLGWGPSWGYWTATGEGVGLALTGALAPPPAVAASAQPWTDTVHLSWAPATSGATADGYRVSRVRESDGDSTPVCGTAPDTLVAALACEDVSVPDGTYHYLVTAVLAGWTATSGSSNPVAVLRDVDAPSVPVASVSPAADENGYHDTDPVTVDLSATDAGPSGVASITYQIDDNEPVTVDDDAASVTVSGDGAHVVSYFATDTAGNVSQRGSQPVLIDTTAPGVSVQQAAGQADPTNADTVQFTAAFTEPVTGFTAADVTVSAAAAGASVEVTGSGAAYLISVTGLTQDGAITVSVGADAAFDVAGRGNTASTDADATVTRDATPPSAPSAPSLTAASDTGTSTSDLITSDATPTFTGSAETGSTVTLYDGTVAVGSGHAVDGAYTITAGTLSEGTHTLTTRATDPSGNTSPPSSDSTVTVTVDTTAPAVEILFLTAADGALTASGRAGAGAGDGSTVTVMICQGTGELGASEPSFPCTPSAVLTASVDGTTAEWSVTSDALAPGTYYVRAEQQDTAGNTGVSGVLSAAIPQP
ncbi:MAG: hypothetical protein JWQ93_2803 [Marmoricola sp.]|nr:hypothetical protein [Marmoricola sp.]